MSDPERVEESFEQATADRLHWNQEVREYGARELGEISGTLDVPHPQCEPVTDGLRTRPLEEALDLEVEALRRGSLRVTHRHAWMDGSGFGELAWGPLERCVWR